MVWGWRVEGLQGWRGGGNGCMYDLHGSVCFILHTA